MNSAIFLNEGVSESLDLPVENHKALNLAYCPHTVTVVIRLLLKASYNGFMKIFRCC